MTPNQVAAAPNEIAPQRAAPPPPPPAIGAAFNQLLSIGLLNASAAKAGSPDATLPNARPKSKNDKDDANTAGAAAVPVPAPQLLPAITVATAAGETTVAAPTLPNSALKSATASGSSAGNADAGTTGNGARLPPGAAELEARIVAAAPNYLSQPNAALSGLWHHVGANANAAPTATPGTGPANGTAAASDGAPAAQTQTAQPAPDAALSAKDLPLDAHAPPVIAAVQTTAADGKESVATGSAVDGSATLPIAAGGPAAPQIAALQAPSAAATAASATQIAPAWEQVAVNLQQAAQTGTGRIEIQLKPASLGAIAVKLDLTHDGRITAVISADRSDTLNLLRQDADALAQSLRDAGLQADAGSLSFNLRGDPQSFAQNPTPSAADPSRLDDPAGAISARIETARYRQHAGALDIEV